MTKNDTLTIRQWYVYATITSFFFFYTIQKLDVWTNIYLNKNALVQDYKQITWQLIRPFTSIFNHITYLMNHVIYLNNIYYIWIVL